MENLIQEEFLKDDAKIKKAANIAYDKIPLFPYRTIVKASIGKDGFTKLIFGLREKMLELKATDKSSI